MGMLDRVASFFTKGVAFVPTGPLTEIDFEIDEDLKHFCFVMGVDLESMMHCERLTAKSDGMLVLDGMGTLPTELMPLIGQGSQGMTTAAKSLACLVRSTNREQGKKSQGFVVSDYRKFKGRWGR